jgi:hypothetical protein
VNAGAYYFSNAGWSVHNHAVVYRDTSAITSPLRVVSAHSTSPVSYPLDTQGYYVQDIVFDDVAGSSYIVWTQSINGGSGTRAKIFSSLMPDPLLAAPTTVQLGGTLATTCDYEAVLSDRTYWQLCRDTGTLSGFTQSTTAAGTTTTMVRPGLIGIPDGDRVAYRRYDGKLYSSPNTGTLTEVKLMGTTWDGVAPSRVAGKHLLFNDAEGGYLRSSNSDGSNIDEPLTSCRLPNISYNNAWPQPQFDQPKTHVLIPGMRCGSVYGEYQVSFMNLP